MCLADVSDVAVRDAPGDGNVHMGSLSVKPKGRSQWQKIKIAQNRDAGVFSMGNVEPFSETRPIC